MSPTYYAIGDVHGEEFRLQLLHALILADIDRIGAPAKIVHVGDYVDRGHDSRGVIARVKTLCDERGAIALLGNHEQMMLNAYDRAGDSSEGMWDWNGGDATLRSYEEANGKHDDWRNAIDKDHIKWMRSLPTIFADEARKIAFVHAGIDPETFPNCSDEIRIWTRSDRFLHTWRWPKRAELKDWLIVHGHTPNDELSIEVKPQRINIDTGAVYGGALTCVVLAEGEEPRFIQT
ncbi:MAG: metallophosphoesterase family protein [Hyphomonadaceae bacterium]